MSYTIGSARIAETGHAGWEGTAKAGDQKQTKTPDYSGEVSMQSFYVSSKGWYVFRFKNSDYANKCADLMKQACNNAHIGYDQSERDTLFNQIKSKGYKSIDQVQVNCETDCSALVRVCVLLASGKDVGNIRTVTMPDMMPKSGLFEPAIKYTSGMKLYTGDILVTCTSGHTVIVVDGEKREAAVNSTPAPTTTVPAKFSEYMISVTASHLNIRKGPSTSYDVVGILDNGHKLTIREEKDGWGRVLCYPDNKPAKVATAGWISLKWVKKI